MVVVSESELVNAKQVTMMSALETIDTAKFTPVSAGTFELATSFPNSRSEKFLDLDGSNNYYTVNLSSYANLNEGIFNIWVKPDFTQTNANYRFIFDSYHSSQDDGIQFYFHPGEDDWHVTVWSDTAVISVATTGQTWSADSVIHFVLMWHKSAGLDGGKSIALYRDNAGPILTSTTTWNVTGNHYTTTKVGAEWDAIRLFDGGFFDASYLSYSTLAASHTDAEIVQALYSNTFNGGTAHKFLFELTAVPATPTGLTFTSTGTTTGTLNWTDSSSNEDGFKIYQDSNLIATVATPGLQTYNITGLTPGVDYNFYVKAYSAIGDSNASNTAYLENGLTIASRKLRLRTNTDVSTTTAMTISDAQLVSLKSGAGIDEFSIDGTLAGNSDTAVPTEKATKTYVDAQRADLTVTSPITATVTTNVVNVATTIAHASTAGNIHLPAAGSANQILKNSGSAGTGSWGTVTENAGALASITTLSMSNQLTNTLADGTAPMVITSGTKVSNLNVDKVDGVNVATLTNGTLTRYNSTGTQIESATVTESSGTLGAVSTINTGTNPADLTINCGSDKTLVLGETVWDDVQFVIESGRVSAANYPDWDATFTANTGCYKFDIDDYIDLGSNELPHWWKEGTLVYPHVHIALDGANTAGASRWVKFTAYIAYADVNEIFTETNKDIEIEVPDTTADLTHLMGQSTSLDFTNVKIGAQVTVRLKRIAATSGTEYPNHVFVTQVGIHAEKNTLGSRTITAK